MWRKTAWIIKNPKNPLVWNFPHNAWFNARKKKINGKGRVKGSYRCMKTKTLEEILKKMTKILLGVLDQSNRERRVFEIVWKWQSKWETKVLKNSLYDFRLIEKHIRSIENAFDWSRTNRASIETHRAKPKF